MFVLQKSYTKAAEGGDSTAIYCLGVMYGDGEGVAKDIQKATRLFTMAAEAGVSEAAEACLANLGHSSSSVGPVRLQRNSGNGQTPGINTKPATDADTCHACGAKQGLLRCARCKAALYCSASCQSFSLLALICDRSTLCTSG